MFSFTYEVFPSCAAEVAVILLEVYYVRVGIDRVRAGGVRVRVIAAVYNIYGKFHITVDTVRAICPAHPYSPVKQARQEHYSKQLTVMPLLICVIHHQEPCR